MSDRTLENGTQETVAQIPMVQSRTWLGWSSRAVTFVCRCMRMPQIDEMLERQGHIEVHAADADRRSFM